MMAKPPRARKPRAPGLSLDLPPPRPLSGLERELYELLVSDLQDVVERRLKADKRKSKAAAELATLSVREEKVRAQLIQFEPELEGMRGQVVPIGNGQGATPPPPQ